MGVRRKGWDVKEEKEGVGKRRKGGEVREYAQIQRPHLWSLNSESLNNQVRKKEKDKH